MNTGERVSNDTAVACLNLADRLWDKYVKNRPAGRLIRLPRNRERRVETKPRRYGKHRPVPARVRAEIVRRARQVGAHYETYQQIATAHGISRVTVNEICRAAGIWRKPGVLPAALRQAA